MSLFRTASLVVAIAFCFSFGWELLKPLPLSTLLVCPRMPTSPGTPCCRTLTAPVLSDRNRATEDVETDLELEVAIISAANLREMNANELHGTGAIVSLNLNSGKLIALTLKGVKQDTFTPHGSSYLVVRDQNGVIKARYYFVVNHAPNSVNTVMRFLVVVDDSTNTIKELVLEREFSSEKFVALNDVAARSKDSFYVSNQHAIHNPTLGILTEGVYTGTGSILYHSEKDTVSLVASSLRYANGVLLSADGRWLFASNMLQRQLKSYAVGRDGALVHQQDISVGMMVDNLSLDPRDGSVWMAGSPSAYNVMAYAAMNVTSESQVMRTLVTVSNDSLLMGPPSTVYLNNGTEIAGSSIAVVTPSGKRLLVGSFGDSKLVDCDLP